MEKINIAEILKDCPKGMELDCAICDNEAKVYLREVLSAEFAYPIVVAVKYNNIEYPKSFTKYGAYGDFPLHKCVIYPKGKTTWEGFVPPCKFKDGDVCCVRTEEFKYIFIFKVSEDYKYIQNYACLSENNLYTGKDPVCTTDCVHEIRLATEEEKEKLFKAIKYNGYKWNPETKTLEKLIEPKFKVGDKIKNKNTGICDKVIKIFEDCYLVTTCLDEQATISFDIQDNWELVPNKFDITTLKPFKSEVLIRNDKTQKWIPAFWGYKTNDNYVTTFGTCRYCIPYEGNENLLSTNNDCDEFYKTW